MKINEILDIHKKLCLLDEKKLPIKLSYAIAKNKRILSNESEIFESQRKKIFEENCLKDNNENPIPSQDGKYQYSNKEDENMAFERLAELANTDVKIEFIKIDFDSVTNNYDERLDILTVSDIEMLDFMIK